jgi:hypothetical protein
MASTFIRRLKGVSIGNLIPLRAAVRVSLTGEVSPSLMMKLKASKKTLRKSENKTLELNTLQIRKIRLLSSSLFFNL